MDFEVGRILDELESLGIAEDVAVLMHSDHGWKLGVSEPLEGKI